MSTVPTPDPASVDEADDVSWVAHLAFAAALLTCLTAWVLLVFMAQRYLAPYRDSAVALPPLAVLTLKLSFFARGAGGVVCSLGLLVALVVAWRRALTGGTLPTILLIVIALGAAGADALFIYAFGQPQRTVEDQVLGAPSTTPAP